MLAISTIGKKKKKKQEKCSEAFFKRVKFSLKRGKFRSDLRILIKYMKDFPVLIKKKPKYFL